MGNDFYSLLKPWLGFNFTAMFYSVLFFNLSLLKLNIWLLDILMFCKESKSIFNKE